MVKVAERRREGDGAGRGSAARGGARGLRAKSRRRRLRERNTDGVNCGGEWPTGEHFKLQLDG